MSEKNKIKKASKDRGDLWALWVSDWGFEKNPHMNYNLQFLSDHIKHLLHTEWSWTQGESLWLLVSLLINSEIT